MTNEPMPWQMTVGKLRKLLDTADENAAVVLKLPAGFSGHPELTMLHNVEVTDAGPVVRILPSDRAAAEATEATEQTEPRDGQSPDPLVCFVDVDDTLVRSAGSKRIPMTSMIERVRALHVAGWKLFCWSTAGASYAKEAAHELGIAACFVGFLPKPHVFLDDQVPAAWRGVVFIHPGRAQAMSVEDFRAAVRGDAG